MMITYGHHMVMNLPQDITVRIAEFKSRLSQYLRNVRRGQPLTLLDRDTPIARVLPYPAESGKLRVLEPTRSAKDVHLPPPLRKRVDSLRVLLEDRQTDR